MNCWRSIGFLLQLLQRCRILLGGARFIELRLQEVDHLVDNGRVVVEGVGNLMHHIARCCQPIPGDEIVGFINRFSAAAASALPHPARRRSVY
jgi:hypothetical protein